MNKLASVLIAVAVVGFSGLQTAEAKHNGGWNNRNSWNGGNDCRVSNRNSGRSTFGGIFGGRSFRHDNGRHLGWYKQNRWNANRGNRWW